MIIGSKLLLHVLLLSLLWHSIAVELKKELTESMLNFTLRFSMAVSDNENETVVTSPFCISMLMAAIQQGTQGDSAKQIDTLLGFGHENSKSYFRSLLDYVQDSLSDDVFHWGNRMYVRSDLEIDTDFQENIKENFNMVTQKVNFNESDFAKNMNDWISLITDENIQDSVNPTFITPDTFVVFLSAICFSDEWDNTFNVRDTEEDYFHVNDKTNVTVPFMSYKNRNTIFGQDNELGFKWIRLGYSKSPSLFILFVLPTERFGLNELKDKLTIYHLLQMMRGNKTEMVNIAIPKFNITTHKLLRPALQKLGVIDVFNKKANLTGMIKSDEEVNVLDITHDCKIEINEKGTTGSAVSSANFQFLSGSMNYPDNPVFRADEPFIFLLYDKHTEFPHFFGQVFNPRG